MTAIYAPPNGKAAVRDRPAAQDGPASAAPVIVLAYPHAGADRLAALLARHPDLACTVGTGILPLCEQAANAWRAADGRPGAQLTPLAEVSIRTLVTSIVTALLAREGKRLWCEIATASPGAAEAFVRLFPGTRIVCLHRACPEVVRAAVQASPWGLAGSAYAPFTTAHPASTVAALTAYWTARTASLLAFERANPGTCLRIRFEDLDADRVDSLFNSLDLEDPDPASPAWRNDAPADPDRADAAGFPAGQLPPTLLKQASRLMEELGYRPLEAANTSPNS
jgi:hypothetical protein